MSGISVCGVHCANSGCPEYNKSCAGCDEVQGKVFWAKYFNIEVCPIYQCCKNEKNLAHCGVCSELPCKIYFDTKDPSISQEQHEEGIRMRVEALKNIIGA